MKVASQNSGCGWAIAIVLGLLLVGQCSDDPPDNGYPVTELSIPSQNRDDAAAPIEPIAMYVTAASVNCRSGPGVSHGKVNSFAYAEELTVSKTHDEWSEISDDNCWISSRFLSEDKPAPRPVVQERQYSTPSRLYGASPQASDQSCGGKWKCGQMNNCSEAYHYLNNCGLGRLDGDGDGVPCESIC